MLSILLRNLSRRSVSVKALVKNPVKQTIRPSGSLSTAGKNEKLAARKRSVQHPLKHPVASSRHANLHRDFATLATTPIPSIRKQRIYTKEVIPGLIEEMYHALKPSQQNCVPVFATGAVSFGAIGEEAHKTMSTACNHLALLSNKVPSMEEMSKLPNPLGPFSNSGEGGELAARNGTLQQSRIRQVASGRFGVSIIYLAHATKIEIKIQQGAKPGKGGELHKEKVTEEIAEARNAEPGTTLVSSPQHFDTTSIEDLAQLIFDLKSANPKAIISVKLAASEGIGVIAAGVAKCGANEINIAGPGGTGAAPQSAKFGFIHPWESALAEVHQTLVANGLRKSVKLIVSGGLQTGLDYFQALLLGADILEVGIGALVAMGCAMTERCHDGTCRTGIATTNQALIDEKFKGTKEDVARYLCNQAISLDNYLVQYGFSHPSQAVGRTDLLRVKNNPPLTGLEKLLHQETNPLPSFVPLKKVTGSTDLELGVISDIFTGKRNFKLDANTSVRTFGARIANFFELDEDKRFRAMMLGPDLSVKLPDMQTKYHYELNEWRRIAPVGSVLFIFSPVLKMWKSYLKREKEALEETTLDPASPLTEELIRAGMQFDKNHLKNLLQKNPLFKDQPQLSVDPVTIDFKGLSVGQSFGFVATHTRLFADNAPDGTGKSAGKAAEIYIRNSVGNQAGYGANPGSTIMAPFFGDRAFVRNSGATGVGEKFGEMTCNLMTRGWVGILGDETHYKINFTEKSTPTVHARKRTVGANFAAGMNGGEIVLPKILYHQVEQEGCLSTHARQFEPQALEAPDTERLLENVKTYKRFIQRPWVNGLLSQGSALGSHFYRLTPKKLKLGMQQKRHHHSDAREMTVTKPLAKKPERQSLYDPTAEKDACGTGAFVRKKREPSRVVVNKVLTMVARFRHRGADGIDPKTGDGCGTVWFGTEGFFQKKFPHLSLTKGNFCIIPMSLSSSPDEQEKSLRAFKKVLSQENLTIADQRDVLTNRELLGYIGKQEEHFFRQYVVLKPAGQSEVEFEKALIRTRSRFLFHVQNESYEVRPHILSASKDNVIYTSLVKEDRLADYFHDFNDPDFEADAGGGHVRFATNRKVKKKKIFNRYRMCKITVKIMPFLLSNVH